MDQPEHTSSLLTPRQPVSPQTAPFEWHAATRPLSDIRETTEPSLLGAKLRSQPVSSPKARSQTLNGYDDGLDTTLATADTRNKSRQGFQLRLNPSGANDTAMGDHGVDGRVDTAADQSTFQPHDRKHTMTSIASSTSRPAPPQHRQWDSTRSSHDLYRVIQNQSRSQSPVKDAPMNEVNGSEQVLQSMPSKTFVKHDSPASHSILDFPMQRHPRLSLNVHLSGPLFVGGSSIEGTVDIVVDEAIRLRHRKSLMIERVSVDLIGFEELSGPKRFIFLALGNELVDFLRPPPSEMVESQQPPIPTDQSWVLVPSSTSFPFLITLPLEIGPPPFDSKHARIRYIVAATAFIREAGRQLCVRSSQDTVVLSVYDPEKALVSLPSPLTASDEYVLRRGQGSETVSVTAGLHRQVWVSGTSMFADVQVINNSRKIVRKLEMQLERIILCYHHTAASTLEMSASQARLFDQLERLIVCKEIIKPGSRGWNSIPAFSTALRTCHLDLPRQHATVKCHKYFEVRYYLNVIASSSHTRLVTVQLPIVLVHMNSLDVPTNAVAQVAAAIEEKRATARELPKTYGPFSKTLLSSGKLQGRAFAAPRMRSLERDRSRKDDVNALGRALERSPRRQIWPINCAVTQDDSVVDFSFKTPPSKRRGRVFLDRDVSSSGPRGRGLSKRSAGDRQAPSRADGTRLARFAGRSSLDDENWNSDRFASCKQAKSSMSSSCLYLHEAPLGLRQQKHW